MSYAKCTSHKVRHFLFNIHTLREEKKYTYSYNTIFFFLLVFVVCCFSSMYIRLRLYACIWFDRVKQNDCTRRTYTQVNMLCLLIHSCALAPSLYNNVSKIPFYLLLFLFHTIRLDRVQRFGVCVTAGPMEPFDSRSCNFNFLKCK